MNLDAIKTWARKHRLPLLGAAGAGVVGLALWQRHRGTATPAPVGDAAGPVGVNASPYPSYYSAGSSGYGYDSSANDVYNSLQPVLEGLGREVDDLSDQVGRLSSISPVTGTPANPSPGGSAGSALPKPAEPAPQPAPQPAPKPSILGYFRKAGTAATYAHLSDNTKRWITQAEFLKAGSPHVFVAKPGDPLLSLRSVGAAPPAWSLIAESPQAAAKKGK